MGNVALGFSINGGNYPEIDCFLYGKIMEQSGIYGIYGIDIYIYIYMEYMEYMEVY